MRRITWMVTIVLCVAVVLAGCGKKEVGDVVKDLENVVGKLDSYKASGSMLLHTGQQPLEYQVEVWFQDPHYYRIALTNVKKDITQIVLRNDDGVFVLTPHLNKSFRFQSDWPDHQGQVYLYQTLVKSILKDNERLYTVDEKSKAYVFDVSADYENSSLVRQKIWLNHNTYAPEHVEISDENANVMVVVEFDHFEFDKEFEKDSFEMQRNMTSWNLQSLPVMGEMDEEELEGEASENEVEQHFGIMTPMYTPEGVEQVEIKEMKLGEDQAVLLRYEGEYNYTIVQARPQSKTVSILPGTLIDLHFTLGVMTGTDHKMLRWISDGVEFRLSTGDLPQSEMIQIAQSVQGQIGK
jgi:outer membrane lipoprotein-sorting protein